jgi:hypothetical protein
MAGRVEGKEDPEEQDHEDTGQQARCAAKNELGMTEKPALIGKEPLREIAAAFRSEQFHAVGQQVFLDDVELRIHHLDQQARLLRQLARSPVEAKPRYAGDQQKDQRQPPGATERKNGRQSPRGSIQKCRKQHACEDEKETRNRLPDQEQADACGEQGQSRRQNAAWSGSVRVIGRIIAEHDLAESLLSRPRVAHRFRQLAGIEAVYCGAWAWLRMRRLP